MPAWILLTLAAAFLQNLRSAQQKDLKTALGREGAGLGATFARFGFAIPFATLFFALAFAFEPSQTRAEPTASWALMTLIAAAAQLAATWALLESFDHAGFAIGAAFSKLEALLAALLGAAFLVYAPTPMAIAGVLISLAGAAALSFDPESAAHHGAGRRAAAQWGLAAAFLFAVAAVGFRQASLDLPTGSIAYRASATLFLAILLQSAALGGWMMLRRPALWRAIRAAWRPGLRIGAAGAGASACWFAAMTLEPAAHVKALGQVELIFAALTGWAFFAEPPNRRETLGLTLIGLGAALLVLGD